MYRREFLKTASCTASVLPTAALALPMDVFDVGMQVFSSPGSNYRGDAALLPGDFPWLSSPFDPDKWGYPGLVTDQWYKTCLNHGSSRIVSTDHLAYRTDYWLFLGGLTISVHREGLLRDIFFHKWYAPFLDPTTSRRDVPTQELWFALVRSPVQWLQGRLLNADAIIRDPSTPHALVQYTLALPREATEGTIWHW